MGAVLYFQLVWQQIKQEVLACALILETGFVEGCSNFWLVSHGSVYHVLLDYKLAHSLNSLLTTYSNLRRGLKNRDNTEQSTEEAHLASQNDQILNA